MSGRNIVAQGAITIAYFPAVIQMLMSQGSENSVIVRSPDGQGVVNICGGRLTQVQWRDQQGILSDSAEAFYRMVRSDTGEYIVLDSQQPCSGPVVTDSSEKLLLTAMQKLDEHLGKNNPDSDQTSPGLNDLPFDLFDQLATPALNEPMAPTTLMPALEQILVSCGLTPSVARVVVHDNASYHRSREVEGLWTLPKAEVPALFARIGGLLPARRRTLWDEQVAKLSI